MKVKNIIIGMLITFLSFCLKTYVNSQAFVDLDSGAVFTGYNNVRISGDAGTLFSLKTDLNSKTNAFFRLRVGYVIKSRHSISVLYAPLTMKSNCSANIPIDFEGVNSPANTSINASYKFNSYRITYLYDFIKRSKFEFGLGFTAKIRDAGKLHYYKNMAKEIMSRLWDRKIEEEIRRHYRFGELA